MPLPITVGPWLSCLGKVVSTASGATLVIDAVQGVGGHSVIYKARLADDPAAVVAVKYLQPGGPIPRSSLLREGGLLANLPRHANLISSFGLTIGELDHLGQGIVLEWAPESLHDRIGKLTWGEFLPIFKGLLAGLAHLHERSVIHRDICPENVLFTPFEPSTPKLADFGISVDLQGKMITADRHCFTKGGYSHPHSAELSPCVGLDLYALGASAYRVLTGQFVSNAAAPAPVNRAEEFRSRYRQKHSHDVPAALAVCIAELLTGSMRSAADARDRVRLSGCLQAGFGHSSEENSSALVAEASADPAFPLDQSFDEFLPPPGGTDAIIDQMFGPDVAVPGSSDGLLKKGTVSEQMSPPLREGGQEGAGDAVMPAFRRPKQAVPGACPPFQLPCREVPGPLFQHATGVAGAGPAGSPGECQASVTEDVTRRETISPYLSPSSTPSSSPLVGEGRGEGASVDRLPIAGQAVARPSRRQRQGHLMLIASISLLFSAALWIASNGSNSPAEKTSVPPRGARLDSPAVPTILGPVAQPVDPLQGNELRYQAKSGEQVLALLGPDTHFTTEIATENGRRVKRTHLTGRLSRLEFQFPGFGTLAGSDATVNLTVILPAAGDDTLIEPRSSGSGSQSAAWNGTFEGRLMAEAIGEPLRTAGVESLGIDTKLTFDESGSVRVDVRDLFFEIPKDVFAAGLQRGLPPSLPVPDHKLADQFLIWRDLQFRKMELTNLVPDLAFDKPGTLAFVMHPKLTGQLERLYEHVVIDFPIETVAKVDLPLIGSREIKTSVPRNRSDWRPDNPAPFMLTATIPGTVEVTECGGETLATTRIALALKTEPASIDDIRLEKLPVIQELAPLLKTGISGFKLPAIHREVVLQPFSHPSAEGLEALSRIRHVKLQFQPQGKTIEFHGSAVIEFASANRSQ